VVEFKYLGTVVTNQNYIHKEIKRRLNSENACYPSVQSLLSSCLLSENMNIIYKTVILLVLYGYETWSLILVEENRLNVFESRALRRISVIKSRRIK